MTNRSNLPHDDDRADNAPARGESASAANDAEERALVKSPLGRWRGPLAVAAIVVIGAAAGLQWRTSGESAAPAASPALSAADARRADEWLAQIGRMLDRHEDEGARTAWRNFRSAYPDYPVPDDVRKRIEALPDAPTSR
jgi:hypothetical protein